MKNSFGTRCELEVEGQAYTIHSLPALARAASKPLNRLPFATRVLLENILRHEDGEAVTAADAEALLTGSRPAC